MTPTREQRKAGARAIRAAVMRQQTTAKLSFDELSADERYRIEEQAEACIKAAMPELERLRQWLHRIDEALATRFASERETEVQRMTHKALAGHPAPEEVISAKAD